MSLISGIPLALIAPFYPPLAENRGVDAVIIGLVLAMHPIG